ncbi:zinc finger Y-chromosomal protein-like [Teleopsis dalmanni]|uniref:zinc finger Y-chromosomal protein-like n=1 Tax=Teleopsis dalmanni TaxID=139649 RepID=UPI0018CEC762|nr:zinc finger Y-chromosomal protein-like [Teleopsis dalmanni]
MNTNMVNIKCEKEFGEGQTTALTVDLLVANKATPKKNSVVVDVIDLLSDDEDIEGDNKNITPKKELSKKDLEYGTEYFAETVLPKETLEAEEEEFRSNTSSPLLFLEVPDCDSAGNIVNGFVSVGDEDTMPFLETDNAVTNNNIIIHTPIKVEVLDELKTEPKKTISFLETDNAVTNNNIIIHTPIKVEVLDEVKTEPMDLSTQNSARDFNAIELCVDDIIDLDDNSDEEVDQDTKATIVNLIVSDDEANMDSNALNCNDSKHTLCHYMCPECDAFCGSLQKWKAHTDMIHKFKDIEKLNLRTIISKEGDLRHQCTECNKKFKVRGVLKKFITHRISHLKYKNYLKCRLCPLRFTNARGLNGHLKKNHEKIFKYYQKLTETNSFLNFLCPVCRKLFNTRSTMINHLNVTHDYKNVRYKELYMTGENNVNVCKLCKMDISNKSLLNHTLMHEQQHAFQCKICNEFTEKSSNACLQHVSKIHKVVLQRSSKCPYCDKVYRNSSMVWEHLQETHGATTVECKICKKTFRSSEQLWLHIQRLNHLKLK